MYVCMYVYMYIYTHAFFYTCVLFINLGKVCWKWLVGDASTSMYAYQGSRFKVFTQRPRDRYVYIRKYACIHVDATVRTGNEEESDCVCVRACV
jgi:hypothetical protein